VRRFLPSNQALVVAVAAAALAFGVAPALARPAPSPPRDEVRMAIFPIDNLAARAIPADELRAGIAERLAGSGIALLDPGPLSAILAERRVRWVGGVTGDTGRALWSEQRTNLVLVTSVDMYDDASPPHLGLSARLVGTGPEGVQVLWAASFALAGEERPGLLGLGFVDDPAVLTGRALDRLADGVSAYLRTGAIPRIERGSQRRFRPRAFHAAPEAPRWGAEPLRIAVLPFSNDSTRRQAGEIIAYRYVSALVGIPGITVVEPGEIRRVLLETRLIQEGGLSYAQAELLRSLLDADLVVTGTVFDYADPGASDSSPMVGFTTTVIDARRRQVASVAFSYATGLDRVFFFDVGEIRTADQLADQLVRGVVEAHRP
jgi:hypothetical protein